MLSFFASLLIYVEFLVMLTVISGSFSTIVCLACFIYTSNMGVDMTNFFSLIGILPLFVACLYASR